MFYYPTAGDPAERGVWNASTQTPVSEGSAVCSEAIRCWGPQSLPCNRGYTEATATPFYNYQLVHIWLQPTHSHVQNRHSTVNLLSSTLLVDEQRKNAVAILNGRNKKSKTLRKLNSDPDLTTSTVSLPLKTERHVFQAPGGPAQNSSTVATLEITTAQTAFWKCHTKH